MKLKIQTITGATHEIEVGQDWTIKQVKREIYRSGKITGAVRILKGQEILPDDNTLVQHNISDGDTVNIIIEPPKQITIQVACPLGIFQHEVSTSMSVRDFKQKLIKSKQVGFSYEEFDLEVQISDTEVKVLENDSLPLHDYGIQDGCILQVARPYIFLTLMKRQSEKVYKKLAKKTTVGELKKMIMKMFCDKNVTDMKLFVTSDDIDFVKVGSNDEMSVGQLLSDGQIVYFLEEPRNYDLCRPVMCQGREIGKVYGDSSQDTVQKLKLRIQDQLGIPASSMTNNLAINVEQKFHILNVDTDNIEVKPEMQISINVTCALGTFKHQVSSDMSVKHFKQKLVKSKQVGFLFDEFDLEAKISDTEVKPLKDDSLSFHDYGIKNGCRLQVVRLYMFLTLMNQNQSTKVHRKLAKKTTVGELTTMIMKLFCDKNVTNITIFATNDERQYAKITSNNDDTPVGKILSEGQIVYFLEDESEYAKCYQVKRENVEIGKVYGKSTDTVRVIKLRVQDQLGIPASCLIVEQTTCHCFPRVAHARVRTPTGGLSIDDNEVINRCEIAVHVE